MKNVFLKKVNEAFWAVLPVGIMVLFVNLFINKMPLLNFALFLLTMFTLVIGIALFTWGAELSMIPFGESVSYKIIKTKNLFLISLVSFIVGFVITLAEPDLNVLASQVPMINAYTLIVIVALGVGIFLSLAFLRVLFQVQLKYILLIGYLIIFLLALFSKESFIALAFDSGGVTTGPMTVPFILSLGLGFSAITSKKGDNDTLGFIALCSMGPVLAVLLLGLVYGVKEGVAQENSFILYRSLSQLLSQCKTEFFICLRKVLTSLSPILGMFLVFQWFILKFNKTKVYKVVIGMVYSFIGLLIFLMSVNLGFMPVGYYIGEHIVLSLSVGNVVLFGFLIGFFVVYAEPAVIVLKDQIEKVTNGMINAAVLGLALALGVAFAVALALIRIFYGISIWYFVLPGYLLAIVLATIIPSVFTAIAFDAGGVASGPITATFLVPMTLAISKAISGSTLDDAFGLVALVAMMPIVTIQVLGLIYKIKLWKIDKEKLEKNN